MTAFAFILGVVPLMRASGAGAGAQNVMGTAVFWGMLVATVARRVHHPGQLRLRRGAALLAQSSTSTRRSRRRRPFRTASTVNQPASLVSQPPPSWDLTRILLSVVAIGGLIGASFWVLRPFLPAVVWATMVVVATLARVPRDAGPIVGQASPGRDRHDAC